MEGVECEVIVNEEVSERNRGRYPRDGHSYSRKYKNYVKRVSRPLEQMHVEGNNEDFAKFVEKFVSAHPEMINWESGIYYSLNKNKRWNTR